MKNLAEILKNGGCISGKHPNYEERAEQIKMFEAVEKTISESRHLIAEAGTGIGKTFAYLIPAIYHSVSSKKPVIISTYTINLQEQIVEKDIPFLQEVLDVKFTAALAKGRNNYICLRRLFNASVEQKQLFDTPEDTADLHKLQKWARETADGSQSDLGWQPSYNVWHKVQSETDTCLRYKCGHFEDCFYQKAKKQTAEANIIVSNHHLYFADLALNEKTFSILPVHDAVVFDEAHRIEAVAQDHLGLTVTSGQFSYLLNSLFNERKKGFLTFFRRSSDCKKTIRELRSESENFFDVIHEWYQRHRFDSSRLRSAGMFANRVSPLCFELSRQLKELKNEVIDEENAGHVEQKVEFDAYIRRATELGTALDHILQQIYPDYVYWVELYGKRTVSLKAVPIDVSGLLRQQLFEKRKTCVLTSATLTISPEGGFDYLKTRMGLDNPAELQVGSPFDYKKQVKLYLVKSMPAPDDEKNYIKSASDMVLRFVKESRGRAFILFTSYKALKAVYDETAGAIMEDGHHVFRQGEGLPRHKMLENFKNNIGSVIFGADSFWQGVDVPGEALENVIIAKLPFPVPSEPLVEAITERLEKQGLSSFYNYSLPEAIIKLKQGFGRLIRSKTDKGIIVILDNRILTKGYGKKFLAVLPECTVVIC
ncbi:MAG: DEAD/DEAH box helicase [Planctomycetes bacterium]|nr:DEAD/DEAH box helicase [Planctomycetota bacterium]